MADITQLSDIDNFLYYGMGSSLSDEIQSDIYQGVMQPSRSFFYYRSGSAGIPDFENKPNGLTLRINLPYAVTEWMARRNQEVSDGTDGTPDRRAVTSQNAVILKNDGIDSVTVSIFYFMLRDYSSLQQINIPLGVSN